MHAATFDYVKPTPEQTQILVLLRQAAKEYADTLEALLPEGPDKTFVIRAHRTNAMWANVAVIREPDGAPRA